MDAQTPKKKQRKKKKRQPSPTDPDRDYRAEANAVLSFLNEKVGRAYRLCEADGRESVNVEMIRARLQSGATVEQCRQVIVRKARQWQRDPKMEPYLRPATLFNREKFESYLAELIQPVPIRRPDDTPPLARDAI